MTSRSLAAGLVGVFVHRGWRETLPMEEFRAKLLRPVAIHVGPDEPATHGRTQTHEAAPNQARGTRVRSAHTLRVRPAGPVRNARA